MLELNKIYCGDNLTLIKQLDDNCIDLTVTSPPYDNLRKYKGFSWDFENLAKELFRVTKIGGVVVWVVGDATKDGSESGTSFRQALFFKDVCGFNLHDTMIYEVAGTGAKGSHNCYWQGFEFMFIFVKGKIKTVNRIKDVKNKTFGLMSRHGRFRESGKKERPHATNEFGIRTNVWRYAVGFADNSDKTNHPAPFPEKLASDHILSWSNEGDLVLDPFTGSGTTPKMAKKLNRDFIGFEVSPEYCKIAEDRLNGVEHKPEKPKIVELAQLEIDFKD